MKIKNLSRLLFVGVIAFSIIQLAGCNKSTQNKESYTITDLRNRKVTISGNVNRVVCIGASALRLYSYVGDMDKLVGVENYEKGTMMPVRPYSYAYKDYFATLPSIGAGGPNSTADAEAILSAKPDVIFSLYDDIASMNNLHNQTKIPVVCLSYGGSDPFSDQVYQSLELIGKIIKNESRSNAIISYIKEIKNDLNNRTKDIEDKQKPTVYLGNNTYNRGNGSFGDTLVNYACFREINAKNVLSGYDYPTNNPKLDYETILTLNPDMVFIDVANINNLKTEYAEHKEVFNQLNAFKTDNIYVQMPFNQYYTNLEIAIADTYYIGKVVFPDAFEDVNPETKFDEICSTMLDKEVNYYEQVTNYYNRGFGKLEVSSL